MKGRRLRTALVGLSMTACGDAPPSMGGAQSASSTDSATTGLGMSTAPADSTSVVESASWGPDPASSTADESTGAGPVGVRYDGVQQKSAHNSYQRDEAIFDQLVYHRIRSLELDIHVGKTFEPTEPGVWYVYHTDVTDDDTWCVRLGHCLEAIGGFTHEVSQHEVVTLWIDLKDGWDDEHGPVELDAALVATFGDALIDGPGLLALAGCPGAASVQAGLTDPTCGWPTMEALRGRVLVVLTGGTGVLRTYHDEEPLARRALVAPPLTTLDDVADWSNTAVFNFSADDVALAAQFVDAGYVARVWDCNDQDRWAAAFDAGAQHVATDKVSADADPWARTHDAQGWPFACKAACEMDVPAPEIPVIGMDVDSGDVWANADSAWFVHDDRSDAADGTWRAFVSTPNSHVEPFAKACLMARASLDPGAPYFAVCRPADNEPLRVQWREVPDGTSTAIENAITPDNTLDAAGAVFVRLRVDQDGTCVAGDGSADGQTWVEIGSRCFGEALALQGLTTSAHDSGEIRLLVGNVTLDLPGPGNEPGPRQLGDFGASVAIGVAQADVYDGPLP